MAISKVAVDTHILIWGVEGNASPGQEKKIQQAESLISRLDDEDFEVFVPALVAGEFLYGFDEANRPKARSILNSHFSVADYNSLSAERAAEVFSELQEDGSHDSLQGMQNVTRQELMTDYHIVGTLISHNVDVLFCEDETLMDIAGEYLEVREMPSFQQNFDFSEPEKKLPSSDS
jgi:predicted nucleic acid-binding protein